MQVTFSSRVSYTARNDNQKDAEKKVVTGGGAVAAVASAAPATNLKAMKHGFGMFSSAKKVSKGMTTVTKTAKTITKKSNTLWAKVGENARWVKNAIEKWSKGEKIQGKKFLKPLVNNKIFKGCVGFLGYGFGVVTLISGLSDITKVATDAFEKFDK